MIQNKKINAYALEARILSFFQEHLYQQFENTATGRTLQDFFNEVPFKIRETKNWLNEYDKLQDEIKSSDYQLPDQITFDKQQFSRRCNDLINILIRLKNEHFTSWPEATSINDLESLNTYIKLWSVSLGIPEPLTPKSYFKSIFESIENKISDYRTNSTKRTPETQRLEEVKIYLTNKINDINNKWPDLDEQVNTFSYPPLKEWLIELFPTSQKNDITALQWSCLERKAAVILLQMFSEKAKEWSRFSTLENENSLALTQEQFGLVDSDMAGQLAKSIQDWVYPKIGVWEDRENCKKKIRRG